MSHNPEPASIRQVALLTGALVFCVVASAIAACNGTSGWGVGDLAPRDAAKGEEQSVYTIDAKLLSRLPTASDSPSPAWSPSGERLTFTESYSSVIVYNVETESRSVVYSYNSPPATIPSQSIYNIYHPAFLSETQVLSGPSMGVSMGGGYPGEEVLMFDASTGAASVFSGQGSRPRLNHDGTRLAFDVMEGTVVADVDGNTLATYPDVFSARWSPIDNRIVGRGLSPSGYYTLVIVEEGGEKHFFNLEGYNPIWHPSGESIAYFKPSYDDYYYGYNYGLQGMVFILDLETGESRRLLDEVSGFDFHPETGHLFFSLGGQLGVSDMTDIRIFDDTPLRWPVVSPSGKHILGLVSGVDSWTFDIVVYTLD